MRRRFISVEDMSVVFDMAKNFDKTADKLGETVKSIVSSLSTVEKATEEAKKRMSKNALSLNMAKLSKIDLSQPISEVKKLSASLLELNSEMENVFASRDNLIESDWSFYRQWLVKNDFAPSFDNDMQESTMHESYESVVDTLNALAFALRNRNDDILRDDRYIGDHQAQSRYIREHDGMLAENMDDDRYNELLAEFKKWQERRNLLGAIIGVEDERTNVQTQINKRRKYLDKFAGLDDGKPKKPIYTIAVEEKPKYVVKGSRDDVRGSYSNAQTIARRIQTDYEIGLIGKDDARKQIAELNAELESLADGLKPIKIDVDSQGFSRAMDTIKSAWGGIQSIGSGVESITSALEGDKNAWESLTGVVSGFIQIMEGVLSAVEIVKMLTTATHAHTAAKAAETAATGASTVASAADAAGKTAEAAASAPVVLANKLSTASFLELASASYFAAHAYIPFAGFGIASGFASEAVAMTKSIGAMAFATGGIVGGNSKSGDRVLARVNSGEMILNAAQQAQLFAIANGRMQPTVNMDVLTGLMAGGAGGVKAGSVVGKIRGRDIVLVAANETRQMRRRSNIKI